MLFQKQRTEYKIHLLKAVWGLHRKGASEMTPPTPTFPSLPQTLNWSLSLLPGVTPEVPVSPFLTSSLADALSRSSVTAK